MILHPSTPDQKQVYPQVGPTERFSHGLEREEHYLDRVVEHDFPSPGEVLLRGQVKGIQFYLDEIPGSLPSVPGT